MKPIFLIGIPIDEDISEFEWKKEETKLSKTIKSRQEQMSDYHVVGYLSNKILEPVFMILSENGKQSNI